ncbi:MAG TPA: DUF4743 domain-containing protein [Burkholderiaceae bacterium]|nr:DUF4743 domain-containing protein [Burkholderiaceae bacterium]
MNRSLTAASIDPHALPQRLEARARQPRPAGSVDLALGDARCGFMAAPVADLLAVRVAGFTRRADLIALDDRGMDIEGRSERLAQAARTLHEAGLVRGWRGELLDVRATPAGPLLARIERAACRTLAIGTCAVHLHATSADGRIWVAQRSSHKAIDPGMWDTLVGGMVPAGESELDALVREAHEEAGLRLAPGAALVRGGRIAIERPVAEGYQVEAIQVFDLILDDGIEPKNMDGEVQAFALRTPRDVLASIDAGEFTLEAALVTLDGIRRAAGAR